MAFQRRRYYTWLFKAYFRRWKKTILGAIVVGIFVSLGLISLTVFYLAPLLSDNELRIGYWGVYRVEDIPEEIINDISMGLVITAPDGKIIPGAAERWEIKGDREYTFYLKKNLKFHNGRKFTSKTVPFNFENVKKEIIDDFTIKFTLKDPYSPFLTAVAQPILLKDLSGLGDFKIKDIDLNAQFVKSIKIQEVSPPHGKKYITFYPTHEALKVAFSLGEINIAEGLPSVLLDNKYDLKKWPEVSIKEKLNDNVIITIFYNTNDNILSDKRVRQALNYALPEDVPFGKRLYSPIKESSIYFSKPPNYGIADKELALSILDAADDINEKISIKVSHDLREVAEMVRLNWKDVGIETDIEEVRGMPQKFQVLIFEMKIPKDPDQYILWHSDQKSNIVGYKNLRIDKLIEDGRSIADTGKRQEIYADFQKYLMDDVPATFLFHPKTYQIIKGN